MLNRCFVGDTREGMEHFATEGHRVQTVVTSPPYWALRDYGVPATAWPPVRYSMFGSTVHIPAMSACLGLEPTPEAYLGHMVLVFRHVRDLLADDGTLWLNMGDSYAGSRCGGDGDGSLEGSRDNQEQAKLAKRTQSRRRDNAEIPRSDVKVIGLKPKDMVGMPWRLAFALQGGRLVSAQRHHLVEAQPDAGERARPAHEEPRVPVPAVEERALFLRRQRDQGAHERGHAHALRAGAQHASAKYREAGEEHRTKQGLAASERKFRGREPDPRVKDDEASARMGRGAGWRNNGVGFGHGFDDVHKPRVKARGEFNEATPDILPLRNKRTVWSIPTEPFSEAHFATFPRALVQPCVLAGSRAGDIVFDPFMGSGTVGAVAASLGRSWLGCELNPGYARMQEKRTAQAGLSL